MNAPRNTTPYFVPVVVKDKKVRVYDTEREAFYAASQTGGVAYNLQTASYNYYPITPDSIKRMKSQIRKWDLTTED